MWKPALILALCACSPVCWEPLWGQAPSVGIKSGHDQKQQAPLSADHANDDQRGTEKSPLVVEAHKRPNTPQEAAEDKKGAQRKDYIDTWTLRLTFAVALFTGLLVLVGLGGVYAAIRTLRGIENQAKLMERQAALMEAPFSQWVDLEPDGLFTVAPNEEKPTQVTINPKWRIINNTALPLTVQTVEVMIAREAGWEVSEFDFNQVLPPAGKVPNYLSFFAPTALTATETADFLASGIELSIVIGVIYLGASWKETRQSFGDLYVCEIGKLEINKPIGKGPQTQEK